MCGFLTIITLTRTLNAYTSSQKRIYLIQAYRIVGQSTDPSGGDWSTISIVRNDELFYLMSSMGCYSSKVEISPSSVVKVNGELDEHKDKISFYVNPQTTRVIKFPDQ